MYLIIKKTPQKTVQSYEHEASKYMGLSYFAYAGKAAGQVSKSSVPQGTQGSNPCLSAITNYLVSWAFPRDF